MSAKRKRSVIWRYFTYSDENNAKCNICKKQLASSKNTSNLWNHLKLHHKKEYEEANPTPENPQTSASSGLNRAQLQQRDIRQCIASTSTTATEEKNKILSNLLVYMIVKDSLPFDFVEGEGFRKLIHGLYPRAVIPSRKTIKRRIEKKYDEMKNKFKNDLQVIDWFAITTDIWTETMTTISYLGVTLHYIKDYVHCSVPIAVQPLQDNHTGENIKLFLKQILLDWDVPLNKVVACLTDGASNMAKAVDLLLGKEKHIHCFAHILNLIAQDSIAASPSADSVIKKVKEIVKFIKKSVIASDEFRKTQERAGREFLKLKKSVKTRWNSTYDMLQRFLELKEYVACCMAKLRSPTTPPPMLSASELEIVEEIIVVLEPLLKVTLEVSAEKHTTLSKVIPLISCMERTYNSVKPKTNEADNLLKKVKAQMKSRFVDVEKCHLLADATMLDARFKRLHFQQPSQEGKCIQRIDNYVKASEQQNRGLANTAGASSSPTTDSTGQSIWSFHDELATSMAVTESTQSAGGISVSFRQYLNLSVLDRKSNDLLFWKDHVSVFPELHKLALKYSTVPASSVPAERLFSKAGNLVTKKRNRLSPKWLTKLTFMGNVCNSDSLWE